MHKTDFQSHRFSGKLVHFRQLRLQGRKGNAQGNRPPAILAKADRQEAEEILLSEIRCIKVFLQDITVTLSGVFSVHKHKKYCMSRRCTVPISIHFAAPDNVTVIQRPGGATRNIQADKPAF